MHTLTRNRKPPTDEAGAQKRLAEIEAELSSLEAHQRDLRIEQCELRAIVAAETATRRERLANAAEATRATEARQKLDTRLSVDLLFRATYVRSLRADIESLHTTFPGDETRAKPFIDELARVEQLLK